MTQKKFIKPPGRRARDKFEEEAVTAVVSPLPKKSVKSPKIKSGKNAKKPVIIQNAGSLLLQATLSAAREQYGDEHIVAAGEASGLLIGIPIPFAMQYVIQNNIWPLSRVVELVGVEKSNKSSLGFEVARWFSLVDGMATLFENETKYSEDMAQSIVGYADEFVPPKEILGHIPCYSNDDWQTKVSFGIEAAKKLMYNGIFEEVNGRKRQVVKPSGRTIPICVILDSLAGGICEENIRKIEKAGHGGRSHPAEALANTQYFKKLRSDLAKWPISFVVVNHLRKQKAENGPHIERRTPGGKHVSFQESFQLELSKERHFEYVDTRPGAVSLSINGNRIAIQCRRSGIGEEMRKIAVNLTWWYDRSPITGRPRQYSRWQWEEATVDLLLEQKGSAAARVRDIVDIHAAKNGRFWSKKLGISKQSPATKLDLGMALDKDATIMTQIADLMAIKSRVIMHAGDDYKKLIDRQVGKLQRKLAK